jgi:ribosomal-protein-alanine N-acetyltransferase
VKHVRLETPRLEVRDLPPGAGRVTAAFHERFWDAHREWEPYRDPGYFTARTQRSILRAERRLDSMLPLWILPRRGNAEFAVDGPAWRGRPVLGSITLSSIIRGAFQNCFLGYKLRPDLYRCGIMREALVAVVEYVFDEIGLHRIEANVIPRNEASLGLLRSLGFVDEGVSRAYLHIQGRWEDHHHMVLLASHARPKNRANS